MTAPSKRFAKTIRALLAAGHDAAPPDFDEQERELERNLVRLRWGKKITARLAEAQDRMNQRCDEAVERLDPEAFERFADEEQAKVDAILQQINDVIDKDLWPKELYFGGI